MGNYVYVRLSFGLTKVGETFQRAMDVAFADFKDKSMVFYQDDLISYSKEAKDHCNHLVNIFIRALKHGVSLNPKKCAFVVIEGNF